jgi:hypothetical protein
MVNVQCPIADCDYETGDLDAAIVAALLTTHGHTHAAGAAAKVEKVRRPSIKAAGSSEEWEYFLSRWTEYCDATKVGGKDKVIQLLECCEDTLRKDVTRTAGGSLAEKSEGDVLAAIKKLAVREEQIMVARMTLHNMRQDHDEPIRNFGARLRGQAGVCKFSIPCPHCARGVNYTDEILRDVLTRGMADSKIQLDLLGDKNQDMNLEEVFKFIEVKEAGKRSASHLHDTHMTEAASSTYSKGKREAIKGKHELCNYCGKSGHGKQAPQRVRKKECPAFDHKCELCNRDHHLEIVCRSKDKPKPKSRAPPETQTCESAVFDALCSVTAFGHHVQGKSVVLDHHIYDQLSETWIKRSSAPQPYIDLTVSAPAEDYKALGFTLTKTSTPAMLPAMADTGCQSCLAGIRVIHRLGLRKADLIPVTMRMNAANQKGITILGAAILRFSGKDSMGRPLETRQMTYITDNSDKLFISKEACIALGIIPENFPELGSADALQHPSTSVLQDDAPTEAAGTTAREHPACNCPKRQRPPPPPSSLPFPATAGNEEKLRQFLLDYYQSSTFNTCEHQPLPMMDGPPMKLMVDPEAEPVAHHTPVPVPIHWQEQVKAGLDQDVRLGVLEPVPVGEPVTWCHRMVVCAKKSGKPRRTVDLQALNTHATRETHHTPSPFHQARAVPHNTKKTIFDAWNGYHSVPIREEDRHLTTFITPWGRYRYKTAPQGYIASGDGYTRRYDEIVAHIQEKTKCVDNALLWAKDIEKSFFRAVEWLDICGSMALPPTLTSLCSPRTK